MISLDKIQLLQEVAIAGSITTIARRQGLSPAAISKKIASIEAFLQVRLFDRAHRGMTLTSIGEQYLQKCQHILDAAQQAERCIANARNTPSGILRIGCGRYFAERFIIPFLAEFLEHYPEISIEIDVTEHIADFKATKKDLAFGSVLLHPSPNLIRRKVAMSQYVLSASPAYLNKHGMPQEPSALIAHRYITSSQRQPDNILQFGTQRIIFTKVLKLNDAQSMLSAALHGTGIVSLNRYILEPFLKSGELIELLNETAPAPKPVYLFYRQSDYLTPKIRVFVDFYMQRLSLFVN